MGFLRTMVIVAHLKDPHQCLGLRVNEIVALKWGDFDFHNLTLLLQRSIVHGRLGAVKTEYPRDFVPLDPQLASVLEDWRQRTVQRRSRLVVCKPADEAALPSGVDSAESSEESGHRCRDWTHGGLAYIPQTPTVPGWDATGAPLKVQQEQMRHASITTTMNVYGRAMPNIKREANSKVVRMVLKKEKGEPMVAAPKAVPS